MILDKASPSLGEIIPDPTAVVMALIAFKRSVGVLISGRSRTMGSSLRGKRLI